MLLKFYTIGALSATPGEIGVAILGKYDLIFNLRVFVEFLEKFDNFPICRHLRKIIIFGFSKNFLVL